MAGKNCIATLETSSTFSELDANALNSAFSLVGMDKGIRSIIFAKNGILLLVI